MSTDRTNRRTGHFCNQRILNPFCCKQSFYFICELSPDTHLNHTHKHDLNLSKYSIKTRMSTDWTYFWTILHPYQPNENCKFICFLKYLMLYKTLAGMLLFTIHLINCILNMFACLRVLCYLLLPKFEKYITK